MSINLDFSNIKDPNISEGDHTFVIEDASVGPAKSGNGDVVKVKVSVVGGDDDDGKNMLHFISLHPDALWSAKLFFEACAGEELESLNIETDDLVGQSFRGTVAKNGTYRNIVAVEAIS